MAELTGANSTEEPNLEEERKKDQRQNEKVRRRSQEALNQALDLEKVKADVSAINKAISEIYGFLSDSDVLADKQGALDKAKEAVIAAGESSEKSGAARKEISKILQEAGLDGWDDPRFDPAKAALKRGEYESAKDLVKANIEDKVSLEEQVKKVLAGINKEKGRVDTGETTAGSEGGFPKTRDALRARLTGPGSVEFYRKNKERIAKELDGNL